MKAILITIQIATRVIVADDATEQDIINIALPRLCRNMDSDPWGDSEISDDTECPYNPEYDELTNDEN